MLPSQAQQLIFQFTKLPGIGPRQAARFVFYLLRNEDEISILADNLQQVREHIRLCPNCYLPAKNDLPPGEIANETPLCAICASPKRQKNLVCLVEKETDALNLEKTGHFQGHYYVLGGFIDPLEKESIAQNRFTFLIQRLTHRGLTPIESLELILALTPRREGDFTSHYIEQQLKPLQAQGLNIKITRLGRGLSSGAELEYADGETLRNALQGRK